MQRDLRLTACAHNPKVGRSNPPATNSINKLRGAARRQFPHPNQPFFAPSYTILLLAPASIPSEHCHKHSWSLRPARSASAFCCTPMGAPVCIQPGTVGVAGHVPTGVSQTKLPSGRADVILLNGTGVRRLANHVAGEQPMPSRIGALAPAMPIAELRSLDRASGSAKP